MTNCGMIPPAPGFHAALRRLTRRRRHAAAHRRDAHHLHRSRRLQQGARPRARPDGDGQADRRRSAGQRLGHDAGDFGQAARHPPRAERPRPFGHRHDAFGQRAAARLPARVPRTRHDRRGLPHHAGAMPTGSKPASRRRSPPPALDWTVSRVGARLEVVFSPVAGAQRGGGAGGRLRHDRGRACTSPC
jgi:glutamate-1-semialdehyde 2,1-aminomutase